MNKYDKVTLERLKGLNIYKDSKGHTIYYDKFIKKPRIITSGYANEYYMYSLRLYGGLLLSTLVMIVWKDSYFAALGVGLAFYLVTSILFYKVFIPKLAVAKDFIPEKKENYIVYNAKDYSYPRLILIILILALLTLILYAWTIEYNTGLLKYIITIVIALVAAFTILNVITLIYKVFLSITKKN